MTPLVQILAWLAIVSVLGYAALPLTRRAFPEHPEVAWGLSRTAGLLIAGWATWVLCAGLHASFGRPLVWGVLLALAASGLAWTLRRERPDREFLIRSRALAQDAGFCGAFALYLAMRGFNPDILSGEKLSDAMFLSALLHDAHVPPTDLWLGGETINYYYFGYFVLATLAKACATPLGLAFNLSLALIFALSVSGMTGLVLAWFAKGDRRQRRTALSAALALEFVLGNLASGIRLLRDPRGVLGAVWERVGMGATRVLTFSNQGEPGGAISEFPSFSFLFADLHPHLLAIPFSFLYLAGAMRLVAAGQAGPIFWGLMALVVGTFGALNSWEMPIALVVLAVAGVVGALHRARPGQGVARCLGVLALVGAGAVTAFLPFYRHFEAPHGATGVQLVLDSRITLGSWLQHFGLLAFVVLAWLVGLGGERRLARRYRVIGGLVAFAGTAIAIALGSPLLWLLFAGLAYVGARLLAEEDGAQRYALLVIMLALGLMIGADLVAVHDHSNTIFKLYVPAWTLLALGATYALVQIRERLSDRPGAMRLTWRLALAGLLGLAAVFPLLAGAAWNHGYARWHGVDGMGFLEGRDPDEARVLAWLGTRPTGSLLDASGPSWSEADRLSVFSGRPTWLGWIGHERLWHEGAGMLPEVESRQTTLQTAFEQGDAGALARAMESSRARFLIARDEKVAAIARRLEPNRLREAFHSGTLSVFERTER